MKIKEKFIKLKHRIENNYKDTSREQWYWVKYHIEDLEKGNIVLIPDGAFHKVWNTSNYKANNPLIFICVFDGGRNH